MANKLTASELREQINGCSSGAREFIRNLFDDGTFLERGTYVKNGEGYFEGVITGSGSVEGRPVFAFVQDFDTDKGAFTVAHGKKITFAPDADLDRVARGTPGFSGADLASRADLVGGAMEALVSAALGLAVALAVTVMYGSLRVRLDRIVVELEAAASQIVGYLATRREEQRR